MSDLKMIMIYNSSLDLENGSNTHVLEISRNLSANLDLVLITPKSENRSNLNFIQEINVFNQKKIDSIIYQITYQAGLLRILLLQCLKHKPDIIYERLCGWSFLPAILSRIFRIPYVVEVNGLMIDELKIGNYPHHYIKLCIWNERRSYTMCKKIICVTTGIKNGIIELYNVPEEKIAVISNGANIDIFFPMNTKDSKRELKLEESSKYVCFVGNLAPWQGVEYLIKAVPFVLHKCPNLNFLVIGDGPMKSELIQLTHDIGVSNSFIFTGSIPYNKVPLYINASDVCVAPFIKERNSKIGLSPLKLYEYMACGKPVVASAISGVSEVLEFSNGGILVIPENPELLANAIVTLLENDTLRKRLGSDGFHYVVANNSWFNIAKKVMYICEDVVSSS